MGVGLTGWRAVAASVAGAGHRARGIGCEDASAVEVTEGGSILVAVADGAGSASLAAEGSTRAVAAAMDGLRQGLDLCDVLALARRGLEPTTDEELGGMVLGDRATTLLVVRSGGNELRTAQVGDGAVVVRRHGVLEVVAADAKGEYLNETTFLTSPRWAEEARLAAVALDGLDAFAVLTDGLQLVALDLVSGAPHAPFFAPFFNFAARGEPVEDLVAFLGSDRVAQRTDDDVTLAIAAVASP